MGSTPARPARRLVGPRAAARAAAAAAAEAEAAVEASTTGVTAPGASGARRTRPRLRVTVARVGMPGTAGRWVLDTGSLDAAAADRLHELVDAAESSGPPAGPPWEPVRRPRDVPGHEVTVARGYGQWTVRVADGAAPAPLGALIEHVVAPMSGVPDAG